MPDINNQEMEAIIAMAQENTDQAVEMLLEAMHRESRKDTVDSEENKSTIPDDPDLSNIKYLRYLRRALKGVRPDPIILVAIDALMRKHGYPILAKVLAKMSRKLHYQISTRDIEAILKKYGKIIIPLMAILFMDIIDSYYKFSLSQEHDNTIKDPTRS